MKYFLAFILVIHILHGAQDDSENDQSTKSCVISSPEYCLAPECGYVACDKFIMLFARPSLAPALYSTYADHEVMKYLGKGNTHTPEQVDQRFLRRAQEMLNNNDAPYYWCIISREGICGVANVWPMNENPEMIEIARMLTQTSQNKKFGLRIFELLFDHFSDRSWYVTSHPNNTPSKKSQESAGFIYQKTEYVEEYNGFRNFYERPSNDEIESREKIRFTYSSKIVSLHDLMK